LVSRAAKWLAALLGLALVAFVAWCFAYPHGGAQ
jgi:hypothetical protein